MARKRIEWEMIEPALRKLKKADLLGLLGAAYGELPASRAVSLFAEYVDLTEEPSSTGGGKKGRAPRRILETVRRFHTDSMAGVYYESFDVNSRNFMETSEGTELWMRECGQLFEKCAKRAAKGYLPEAREAMDLLFELLDELDTGSDRVVFFADEGGSWQVGWDAERILPAYFQCLAAEAEPDQYATRVVELIKEHCSYKQEDLLTAARKVASKAQRNALAAKTKKSNTKAR